MEEWLPTFPDLAGKGGDFLRTVYLLIVDCKDEVSCPQLGIPPSRLGGKNQDPGSVLIKIKAGPKFVGEGGKPDPSAGQAG